MGVACFEVPTSASVSGCSGTSSAPSPPSLSPSIISSSVAAFFEAFFCCLSHGSLDVRSKWCTCQKTGDLYIHVVQEKKKKKKKKKEKKEKKENKEYCTETTILSL